MTRKKKAIIITSATVVLVILCASNYLLNFRYGRRGDYSMSAKDFMLEQQHVTDQMKNGTCGEVKQAINDYLKVLDKYNNGKGIISKTRYYDDRMLAYVRLARVERHMGNDEQAQQHMSSAKEVCTQLRRDNCSAEALIWFTKQFEKENPIACLANE